MQNRTILRSISMLSNEQIKDEFRVLAAETEKYAEMYKNFGEELKNVILYLRNFLKHPQQNEFDKFCTALRELNYEVFHFCVHKKFLTGQQQANEFYKSIPDLIESYKKTLPFLEDMGVLIETTQLFKEDGETTIQLDRDLLFKCYKSLHTIFTEARIVKPLRNFYNAIENLQHKYALQINYEELEQGLLNIINEQKKIQAVVIFKDTSYYRAIDWKFFKVIYKKYQNSILNENKQEILNTIKEDVSSFGLQVCKIVLLIQNQNLKYFKEETAISMFVPKNLDFFKKDYDDNNLINVETSNNDKNQYAQKECDESLLPITRFVKYSPMLIEEEIILPIPSRFEVICLLPEDFPTISISNVQFVQEAVRESFRLKKSNQYPDQKLIQTWEKNIAELKENTDKAYIPLIAHLQVLINFWTQGKLESDLKSDHHSLQWYNAYEEYDYVVSKKSFKNIDLSTLVEAISSSTFQTYIENISSAILLLIGNYYTGSFYFDEELFLVWRNKLQQSPRDLVEANKRISDYIINSAEFLYLKKMYAQGMDLLINQDYFERLNSVLLQNLEEQKQTVTYEYNMTWSISKDPKIIPLRVSKLELLKFCTQLTDVRPPIITIEIKGLSPTEKQQYYEFVKKFLQNEGYANSEGRITGKAFKKSTIEPQITDDFVICSQQATEKFIKEELKKTTIALNYNEEIIILKDSYTKQVNAIKSLSYSNQFLSLALISGAMEKTENINKANQIQQLVKDCFRITYINAGRFKNNKLSEIEKHNYAFKLSGDIVQKFLNSDHSFIFQVITSKGDHAFFVGIKNMFYEEKFQIIIIDGGGELPSYKKSIYINDIEYKDPTHGLYHPMGSKVLEKIKYEEFLQHYIYRVLVFRYTSEADKDKNIYLLKDVQEEVTNFSGYSEKIFEVPSGISLSLPFRAQMFDNCAIYNFVQCLRYLLDMTKIQYSVFMNELLKGTDNMISEFLKKPFIIQEGQKGSIGSIFTGDEIIDTILEPSIDESFNHDKYFLDSNVCETNEYHSFRYHDQCMI